MNAPVLRTEFSLRRVKNSLPRTCLVVLLSLAASLQAQELRVWGDDTYGQISTAPTVEIKAVVGGAINLLALRADGRPILAGAGPIGPPPIPASLASGPFQAAAIGRDDALLIRTDGTLAGFGRNPSILDVPPGAYRAVAVAGGHAVAIGDDGRLTVWGPTPGGPLADLLNAPQGGPFKAVDAEAGYALALHEDGTLYGWGYPSQGTNVLAEWTPTPGNPRVSYIPGETYSAVSAGNVHALALRPDGTVTGWGNDSAGALDPPTHVKFKAIAAGWGFSLGLSTDGTLWGWGRPVVLVSPFATAAWTFESQGWTRYENTGHFYIPNETFSSISASAFNAMAITATPPVPDVASLLRQLRAAVTGKGPGRILERTTAQAQVYNDVPDRQSTCAALRFFDIEVRATWKLSKLAKKPASWKITSEQLDDWLGRSGAIQIALACDQR